MELIERGRSSDSTVSKSTVWNIFGHSLSRKTVVYFSQIILVYIVAITSLVNLTLNKEKSQIWIALLSSCIGYILPSPTLDFKYNKDDESILRHIAE